MISHLQDVSTSRRRVAMKPVAPIESLVSKNQELSPYLIKGREFSNPDPRYVPFFSCITKDAMSELQQRADSVRYFKQAAVRSNDFLDTTTLFAVFSGKVCLSCFKDYKTFLIPSVPYSGGLVLLTKQLTTTASIGLEKTAFAVISKAEFSDWLLGYPSVKFRLLDAVPDQLDS